MPSNYTFSLSKCKAWQRIDEILHSANWVGFRHKAGQNWVGFQRPSLGNRTQLVLTWVGALWKRGPWSPDLAKSTVAHQRWISSESSSIRPRWRFGKFQT